MAKYISGSAKRGTTTYYFVKDAVTGKLDTDCTRYLKHKVRQNRANNTIKRIAYILPFYMNYLSDKGLTLRAVSDLKFSEQSEHFSDFLMAVKKGAHTGSMKEVKNNTANSYLQAVFGLYDFLHRDGTLPYLKVLDTSELSHLKTALETLGKLYECEHLKALFLPTDFSKKKLPVFTFYSDAELSRLHEAYRFLDKQTARILLLHELLGLRISDTLTLKVTDIVMEPKPHLKILQQKTGNYLKKSINNDILLLLNASIKETYETYGEQEYIFVCDKDPKSPLPYKTVYYRLQVLINTHDLKDDHGNPLTAGTHIFRRTYGKKLCDLNLDDVTISSVIGHHGTGSVANYRRMSSKVLAANTKTVIDKRNDKIHKYRKGWMK